MARLILSKNDPWVIFNKITGSSMAALSEAKSPQLSYMVGEQFITWRILRRNDRKSRYRRIKKQRLAATSQLSLWRIFSVCHSFRSMCQSGRMKGFERCFKVEDQGTWRRQNLHAAILRPPAKRIQIKLTFP